MFFQNKKIKKFLVGILLVFSIGLALHVFASPVLASSGTGLDLGINQVGEGIGLPNQDIRTTVAKIIRVALGLLGIVALGIILYAGYLYMTAGGNEDQIGTAKKWIRNGVIGLVIILSAYAIVSFVINSLTEAINYPTHCYNKTCDGDESCLYNSDLPADCGGSCAACKSGCTDPSCTNFVHSFFVRSLPDPGQKCVVNVGLRILFSQPVNMDTLIGSDGKNKIRVVKEDNTYVDGTWIKNDSDGYEVIFKPAQTCGGSCSAAGCFDPKAKYLLKFPSTDAERASIISTSGDTLKCFKNAQSVGCDNVSFTTGETCDTQSPNVSLFVYPMITSGETAPFYTTSTDDTGVKQTSLYVDGVGSPVDFLKFKGCSTTVSGILNWATPVVQTTVYRTATVKSYDDDSNTGTAQTEVALMPPHCGDHEKNYDETNIDCGGSCPSCDICTKNLDCRSGYCDVASGKCLDRIVITNVSPLSAGKGSFVTISGNYFGDTPGTVEFQDQSGTRHQAKLANCGSGVSAWSQWEIIVESPFENGQTGPIIVKRADWTDSVNDFYKVDTTWDNWGGFMAYFTGTDKVSPSLCPINPNRGTPKASVFLKGKYFGAISGARISRNNIAADYINFGKNKAQVVDWGEYDGTTQLERITGLVPGIASGWVGVQVFNDGHSSNAVSYYVRIDTSNDPRIDNIDPTSGADGEYITISGSNFGKDPGQVLFYKDGDLTGTPIVGSNNFPPGCDSANTWGDNQIVVKFPEKSGTVGSIYYVVVKRNTDSKTSPAWSGFTLTDGLAKPGICKISPSSAPIPLPSGTYMEIIGERLTSTTLAEGDKGANVYFWTNGANASTTADGKLPADHGRLAAGQTFTIENLSLGQRVYNLSVPDLTKTGPVLVERSSDKKVSNALKFSESNCVANGQAQNNLCGAGKQCCAINTESGYCIAESDLCPGTTRSTGYSWRFTTRDILPVPRVVESCNDTDMPSPSPNAFWDSGNTGGDHHNTCRQALLTVEFNMAMDSSTLNKNNIIVRECASTNSNTCINPGVALAMKDIEGKDGSNGYYITAGAASAYGRMDALKLSPDNASTTKKVWKDNTWYQVILTKNIKSMPTDINDWANTQSALSADKTCSDYADSAYCFVFKTDSQDCKLKRVMILPTKWWTSVLEEPIKKHDVTGDYNLYWEGVGVSTQKCILMDAGSHNWVWDVLVRTSTIETAAVNTQYSKVTDLTHKSGKIKNLSYLEQFDALKNTAKIGLFDLDGVSTTDSVFTHTSVTVASSDTGRSTTYEASSPLTIDLSNPQVVDYWPNCLEACTDAEVGVRFNTTMSNVNLNHDGAVKIYRCIDENCLSKVEATDNFSTKVEDIGNTFEAGSNYTILKIANSKRDSVMLASNTLYLVTISAPSSSPDNMLWSANEYNRPDTQGKPFNQEFSWRFKTKSAECLASKVIVTPLEYISAYIGDKSLYTAQPYSSPDSCAKNGQRLNPWSVQWDWFVPDRAPDKYIAQVFKFTIDRKSDYCTSNCLLKGSDIPAESATSTTIIPICGNGRVEAGEDCDPPNKDLGCSLKCLNIGNWDYTLLSKTNGVTGRCGDGEVNISSVVVQIAGDAKTVNYGEECDYTSPDPLIRYGCTKTCLHEGSKINPSGTATSSSICGNGIMGTGENCELGITGDPLNSQSSLGCLDTCLHTGTAISKRWCADHFDDYGGFTSSSYKAVCAHAYSQCGDGITSLDEDIGCENSTPPYWNSNACDAYCLKKAPMKCVPNSEGCGLLGQPLGSSLTSYTTSSFCGDGFAGIGEDKACETDQYRTEIYTDGIVSPWAIGKGIGLYATTSTVDSQSADIDAKASGIKVKDGEKVGTGKFTIPCGFDSDESCQNAFGDFAPAGQEYGVGTNSCCFLRPQLVDKYPANNAKDVCPNTVIRATFDQKIDQATLSGNALLAFGMTKEQVDNFSVAKPVLNKYYSGITSTNHLIENSLLYLIKNSEGNATLEIRRINSTSTPSLLSSITTSSANYTDLIYEQNYILAAGTQGVDVYAVLNSKAPKFVYRLVTEAPVAKILVSQNYLFAALNNGKLVVWKMDSDVNYIKVNELNLGGNFKFYLSSSYLYTVGSSFGVKVFGISEAVSSSSPRLVASLNGAFTDLAYSGDKIYLTRNNNLDAYSLNWNSSANPVTAAFVSERTDFVISTDTLFAPTEIKIKGDYAYLSDSSSQLQIVRIAATSTFVRTFVISGINNLHFSLDEYNKLLYVFGDSDLRVYNIASYFTPVCETDVTSLVASAFDVISQKHLPWYQRIWNGFVDFVKNIFGMRAFAISTVPRTPIVKWCVSNNVNNITAETVSNTSTSYVNFNLDTALSADTDYAVILTDNIKDVRGVSIGKTLNNKAWGWKFTTDNKPICQINKTVINPVPALPSQINGTVVTVNPTSVFFTRLNTITTLEADVYEASGQMIQPVAGYEWDYRWKPTVDSIVLINSTTSQFNNIQAHNQNGDATVVATANLLTNDFPDYTTGATGTPGTAAITVFLCENPWPPIQQGEYSATNNSVFPYADSENNKNNFNFNLGNYGQFDGTPIIPGNRGRYFNFKFYYCADSGANGTTTDDLPYFTPAVQPGRPSSYLDIKTIATRGFDLLLGLIKPEKARAADENPTCSWVWSSCAGSSCGGTGTQTTVCKSLGLLDCSTCSESTKPNPSSQQCTVGNCCGNGIKETGETCDDGNTTASDGCSATCQQESGYFCYGQGNGSCYDCNKCYDSDFNHTEVLNETIFVSGGWYGWGWGIGAMNKNGYTIGTNESGECGVFFDTCAYDGNANSIREMTCHYYPGTGKYFVSYYNAVGQCANGCYWGACASCGDGIKTPNEACDDGNTNSGDGCSTTCTVEASYNCSNTSTSTPSVCTKQCGNDVLNSGEACDDGNTTSGDGCSSACAVESGYTCSGSACCKWVADNNSCNCSTGKKVDVCKTNEGTDCSICTSAGNNVDCTAAQISTCDCGNGVLDTGETCDDGNTTSGDGCSAACVVETNYKCSGAPSTCCKWVTDENNCVCSTGKKSETCQTSVGTICASASNCGANNNIDCTANQNLSCKCGNGALDTGEKCDVDINGKFLGPTGQQTCSDFGNYNAGSLTCANNCQSISVSNCHYCGDGLATDQEQCDKTDFKGLKCTDFLGGTQTRVGGDLDCNTNCTISTSTCHYCGDGSCNSDTEDYTNCPSDCETPGLIGKSLKRFIFTNKNNNDAIGIQVFDNPEHLTVAEWYSQNEEAAAGGSVQSMVVDGYEAITDGKNLFIDALNYVTSTSGGRVTGKLYSNIYLFSRNSDASDATLNVFEQIIKNLKFNANLANYGYCGLDVSTPDYKITCTTDNDCPRDCNSDTTVTDKGECVNGNYPQFCSNQSDKLKRNYQRLRDLQKISNAIYSSSKYNGLISYWDFDGYIQDGSRNYVNDVVGKNNFECVDGSCTAANFSASKFGKSFDATFGNQLVSVGDSSASMNGQATIIFWFNPVTSANYNNEVFGGFPFSGSSWSKKDLWNLYYVIDSNGKINFQIKPKNLLQYFNNNATRFADFVSKADSATLDVIGNSSKYTARSEKFDVTNGVNFLSVRISGNAVSFNFNNNKSSSTTISSWGNLNLGRILWSGGNEKADELFIFNRVLSDSEINAFQNDFVTQKNKIGTLPTISEGSYLAGQTLSTWDQSWSVLSSNLGLSLPSDPINKLGGGGTCGTSSKASKFCFTDSDCVDGETCVLHDSTTGWSAADRRFSFACDDLRSFAYRYIYDNDSASFMLRTKLENAGLTTWDPTNYNDFINAFIDPARVYLYSVCNSNGTTNGSNEVTSMAAGVCGDGVVNLNMGEECDPKGATQRYNPGCASTTASGDNGTTNNTYRIRTCNSSCKWDTPDAICHNDSSKLCGNGKIDAGEECDDGVLNGTYNHCALGCKSLYSDKGYCGDGKKQSQELCDPTTKMACSGGYWPGKSCTSNDVCNTICAITHTSGIFSNIIGYTSDTSESACKNISNGKIYQNPAGLSVSMSSSDFNYGDGKDYYKAEWITFDYPYSGNDYYRKKATQCLSGSYYNLNKIDSCSWDCQHYGEYCGDGVTQSDYEQCDGNQVCTTDNGRAGKRYCNNVCKMVNENSYGSFDVVTDRASWDCVPDSNEVTSNVTKCGDGVIDTASGELCDAGNKNGVPCTPGVGGSCSYCSWDCRNVLDVNNYVAYDRTRDCGDGVVQAPYEICDNKNNTACNSTCDGICGNGKVEGGEYCDPADPITKGGCGNECYYTRCKIKYCEGISKNCFDITKSWYSDFINCNKNYNDGLGVTDSNGRVKYNLGYCGDGEIQDSVAHVIKDNKGGYGVTSQVPANEDDRTIATLEECEPGISNYDSNNIYQSKEYEECVKFYGNVGCTLKGYSRVSEYLGAAPDFIVRGCSDGSAKFNSSDLACTFVDKSPTYTPKMTLCGTEYSECNWSYYYDQNTHTPKNCTGNAALCNTCEASYGGFNGDDLSKDGYWMNYTYQSGCMKCDAVTGNCNLCTRSCRLYENIPAQK